VAVASAAVRRRMGTLAVLELVNIPLIAWVVVTQLRMPLTAGNVAGLSLVLLILAEGSAYWWLKLRQLAAGDPAPAGMAVYRVVARANVALLAGGAILIGAGAFTGGAAGAWPGALLWGFAALEHVNYFHLQLMHDTRADVARLFRTRRLRRSHLARDLDRRASG
jgi:hypothetical protein